jgi:hypothetical protein
MMGSVEDPKDGAAVASTVFSAVIVYIVCTMHVAEQCSRLQLLTDHDITAFLGWLWPSSVSPHPGKPKGRHQNIIGVSPYLGVMRTST